MSKEINVLIIGANFTNKGAEAMLKVVKQQLERNYEHVTCYMVCRQYERELAVSNGFVPVFSAKHPYRRKFDGFLYRVKGKLHKLLTGKNRPWYFPFPFPEIGRIMDRLNAVIDVSGFAYADSWGKPMIDETIRLISMARRKQVKTFFLPQAWGPFESPGVARSAREMLERADGFYARDTVSQAYLARLLGRDVQRIPLLPDIVFSLADTNRADELPFPMVSQETKRPLRIGVSPNLRVYEKVDGEGSENSYMRVLLSLCRYCLETLGAEVILIPNELFPGGVVHTDDRVLCRQTYEMLGDPDRCTLLDHYASAETIRNHIRQVDLLVSSRFHALIFGFLEQKPVMAISWSHKYRELFGLFDMEHYVLESDAIDEDSVIAKFRQLIDDREGVAETIAGRLPGLKARIDHMFKGLLD
ncbi:polysaccharide pyruvyl transferase family protein [Parapedobacter sp.]